ncbi:ABC transporter permease [Streptomyces sp. NBC_00178]|uniref:ABC transporter permease n=1 Tax=Streptomyces sp. NBC_00178 TaxID=2975672 RepID=UPI002E2CD5B3|nr:ABC transporter permease [Streptomyces sp. NBC_00178]
MSTNAPRTRERSRRPRLSGLTWLIWRQNRTAFWLGLAAAAALAVYAVVQHQNVAAAAGAQHLQDCHAHADSIDCVRKLVAFQNDYQNPIRRPLQAMLLLPFLFGLFLGGPQLAQELESGTYRTVATQSVTRMRWFMAKLCVPLAMVVVISGVMAAAMTWWWHPIAETAGYRQWQYWYPFYGVGPVVVGLGVLIYLLGVTLGLYLRRTVLAMGATLALGGGLFAVIEWARPHLPPRHTATAQHTVTPPVPDNAWLVADGPLSPDGRRVPEAWECFAAKDPGPCLGSHGISGRWAEFHPVSDLWPLQWATTGICVLLAVVLVAVSAWWVRNGFSGRSRKAASVRP